MRAPSMPERCSVRQALIDCLKSNMLDSTTRFSSRVNAYARTRPDYPAEIRDTVRHHCGLQESPVIADIGSGHGILTRVFLQNGNTVSGVEPARQMRDAGESRLAPAYPLFQSIGATAETASLPNAGVDFVT